MTSRRLIIFGALVIVAALGLWRWLEKRNEQGVAVAGTQPAAAPSSPSLRGPTTPDSSATEAATSKIQTTANVTVVTRDLTSAVAPGSPVVRTDSTATSGSPVATGAVLPAATPTAPSLPDPEGKIDLEGVRAMLLNFRTRMGENPVGSNAEIMRAVMGGNSAGANLGPPSGQNLNEDGELMDRWGTPYFFHQLAKNSMEIRSAGPDRQMWTADDLVTK